MNRPELLLIAALLVAPAHGEEPPAPLGLVVEAPEVETIQQRDKAGRVRVARQVCLNEAGDYVNHGTWRSWDADGQLVGQGRYAWGEPAGAWSRWADEADSPLLATAPFARFSAPFLSQANYQDGKLDGRWSIFDADGRLVSEVHFADGKRHGEAVLKTPAGEVFRRQRFENDLPTGDLEELTDAGELRVTATYEAGRRQIERVERYDTNGLKSRESWLGAVEKAARPDDPWRLRLARYKARGEELRHGRREAWWPNGQPKLRADYHLGQAGGTARWWHANGQLALQGAYEEGLAAGEWSWWRENGVRAASCQYRGGQPADWSMWAADGRRVPAGPTEQLARDPSATLRR